MDKLVNNKDPIFSLITSTVRVKILNYFLFVNTGGDSIRGTARFLNENPAQVRKELINLEKSGILSKKKTGNQNIYSINPRCNFIDDLKNLFFKAGGYTTKIKNVMSNIEGIQLAFIYGSYANEDFSEKSDVDVFILGEPNLNVLNKKIHEVEKQINREINYVVMSRKEFEVKKRYGFVKNILKNKKIFLIGVI